MKKFTAPFTSEKRCHSIILQLTSIIFMCHVLISHDLQAQPPDLAWMRFADGAANDRDRAESVTTDEHGNVYVTGMTRTASGRFDCLTIMYDREGVRIWDETYDVVATDGIYDDSGIDIAIDPNGDIYVIGIGSREVRNNYGFILKYSPSGTLLWSRQYREARFYFVDVNMTNGDVIVAGNHIGFDCTFFCDSFLTVCYDSRGNLRWDRIYGRSAFDYTRGSAVDNNGNVYISGASGIFPSEEMTTIKYSPGGAQLYMNAELPAPWVTGSAMDMAADALGNVYVAGGGNESTTTGHYDLILIKYEPSGVTSYVVSEPDMSPGQIEVHENHLYALLDAVDGIKLVKYDAVSGARSWITDLGESELYNMHLEVDHRGNVYVANTVNAGTEDATYWIAKYDTEGIEKWRLNEPATGLTMTKLHIDEYDVVYVGGFRTRDMSLPNVDYLTAKYEFESIPIIPEGLRDYRRIEVWGNSPFREWCWTDIGIDWDLLCVTQPFCADPTIQTSLTENGKIIWQEAFSKPFNFTFSIEDKLPNVLTFARPGENPFLILDDNLVHNNISSVHLSAFPKEGLLSLAVETDEGKSIPFSMALLDKEGKEIWRETFIAPLTKEINASVKTWGATLKISALPPELELKYYPNPTAGKLTVEIQEASKQTPAVVSIFSLMGEQLLNKLVDSNSPYVLDLGKQKPGLYVLSVKFKGKEASELIELKY